MLYTSWYAGPVFGEAVSVSWSSPPSFYGDRLDFLAPTPLMVEQWHKSKQSEEVWNFIYVPAYRRLIESRWVSVKAWLDSLNPNLNQTLLCYENLGKFCHRHLIAKIIQKQRPDCWGGELFYILENREKERLLNVKVLETEMLTTLPNKNDEVEVFCPKHTEWLFGTVEDVYFPPGCPSFSFIEVRVFTVQEGSRKVKAYGLHQLRKYVTK